MEEGRRGQELDKVAVADLFYLSTLNYRLSRVHDRKIKRCLKGVVPVVLLASLGLNLAFLMGWL